MFRVQQVTDWIKLNNRSPAREQAKQNKREKNRILKRFESSNNTWASAMQTYVEVPVQCIYGKNNVN